DQGRAGGGLGRAAVQGHRPATVAGRDLDGGPEAAGTVRGLAEALAGGDVGIERRNLHGGHIGRRRRGGEAAGAQTIAFRAAAANRSRAPSRSAKSAATCTAPAAICSSTVWKPQPTPSGWTPAARAMRMSWAVSPIMAVASGAASPAAMAAR